MQEQNPGFGQVRPVVEQLVSVQENIQVVLAGLTQLATGTDGQVGKLASALDGLATAQRELAGAQQQCEEKLNALIAVVDGLVRRAEKARKSGQPL